MKYLIWAVLFMLFLAAVGAAIIAVTGYVTARKILKKKSVLETAEDTESRSDFCPFDAISEKCKRVFIGTEDQRFYKHHGTDWYAFFDAMDYNFKVGFWKTKVVNGKRVLALRGSSTITNQLARNLFLSHERTLKRKAAEYFITREIEKRLSKDRILALYLNVIDYSDSCTGILPASRHYFSIEPSALGINQTASLQAIIKLPGVYHPIRNPKEFALSKRFGLGSLVINGVITKEMKEVLLEQPWDAPDMPGMECLPVRNA